MGCQQRSCVGYVFGMKKEDMSIVYLLELYVLFRTKKPTIFDRLFISLGQRTLYTHKINNINALDLA